MFASNLEYVHSVLNEEKISHFIDLENNTISSDLLEESKIIKIIEDLNLDEKEVEVDENFQNDFDEWHKNSLNPGHFLGGKNPFFEKDHNNYLMYGFVVIVSGIACLIELLNSQSFSRTAFWIFTFIILAIAGSMVYQFYKFKKRQKS